MVPLKYILPQWKLSKLEHKYVSTLIKYRTRPSHFCLQDFFAIKVVNLFEKIKFLKESS